MAKLSDYGYVADRWQHTPSGKRIYSGPLGGSGWMVVDKTNRGWEDGVCYQTKREAEAALRDAVRETEAASAAAAALGRRGGQAGRGEAKRRDVDYAALGRKGGLARKG